MTRVLHSYKRPSGEPVEFRVVPDGKYRSLIVSIGGVDSTDVGPFRTDGIAYAWARGWQSRDLLPSSSTPAGE